MQAVAACNGPVVSQHFFSQGHHPTPPGPAGPGRHLPPSADGMDDFPSPASLPLPGGKRGDGKAGGPRSRSGGNGDGDDDEEEEEGGGKGKGKEAGPAEGEDEGEEGEVRPRDRPRGTSLRAPWPLFCSFPCAPPSIRFPVPFFSGPRLASPTEE